MNGQTIFCQSFRCSRHLKEILSVLRQIVMFKFGEALILLFIYMILKLFYIFYMYNREYL